MTTRNQVIKKAASYIGYTEKGNNQTQFWARQQPSFQGQPWCAAFVVDVLMSFGIDLMKKGPSAPYYTPSMEAWAKKTGRWGLSKNGKPGDVLIFGNGHATHTGFLERQDGPNYVITIEGNTSSGSSGSQTNGGGVYRRRRPRSWIRGCISMAGVLNDHAAASSAPPKPVAKGSVRTKPTGPFPLPEGHWYGPESNDDRNHSGLRTSEREGIRQIQRLLGLKADGGYGPVTKAGVVKWQKEHKLGADGLVGAITWKAMSN